MMWSEPVSSEVEQALYYHHRALKLECLLRSYAVPRHPPNMTSGIAIEEFNLGFIRPKCARVKKSGQIQPHLKQVRLGSVRFGSVILG